MTQGIKALVEGKLETNMKGREELLSKMDKVAHSAEKSKRKEKKKAFENYYEQVEKEIEELSPLGDELLKPKKKSQVTIKKKALREQFKKRREEKERSKFEENEEGRNEEGKMEEPLFAKRVSKIFIVEKGLYPYKGIMPEFLASPIQAHK